MALSAAELDKKFGLVEPIQGPARPASLVSTKKTAGPKLVVSVPAKKQAVVKAVTKAINSPKPADKIKPVYNQPVAVKPAQAKKPLVNLLVKGSNAVDKAADKLSFPNVFNKTAKIADKTLGFVADKYLPGIVDNATEAVQKKSVKPILTSFKKAGENFGSALYAGNPPLPTDSPEVKQQKQFTALLGFMGGGTAKKSKEVIESVANKAIKEGGEELLESAAPVVNKIDSVAPKQRKFIESAKQAPVIAPEVKQAINSPSAPITNKATFSAAKNLVDTNYNKALETFHSGKTTADVTAVGQELILKAQREGRIQEAVDFTENLAEKLEKAGQMVQAASVIKKLSPEGVLLYAQKLVKKANQQRLPLLTKEKKLTPELANKLAQLADDAEKAIDPVVKDSIKTEIGDVLQQLKLVSIGKKISTAQTISQLLNPKTIGVRNPLGNEIFYRLERVNKYLASGIDWASSGVTGGPRTVTFRTGGSGGFFKGLLEGAKSGWQGRLPDGLGGQFDFQQGLVFQNKWNPLTYFEKALKATLQGFDYAAYSRAANQTTSELAYLLELNRSKLAKGARNPEAIQKWITTVEDNVEQIASDYGKYVTYQDDNLLSKGLGKIKRGLNLGQDFGAGDLIVKYTKTTGALILRSLDYSPAGFLRSAAIIAEPILKKGPLNQRELTLALSRAITGTLGLTGMGYYLADKGIITGKYEPDKDLRSLKELQGVRKYQVNTSALLRWVKSGFDDKAAKTRPNDRLVSYDWAQPVAMSLSIGANINKEIEDGERTTAGDIAGGSVRVATESLAGGFGTIAEQPVLQGLTRLIGNPKGIAGVAEETADQLLPSMTPTLLSQVNQRMDNTVRSTYDPSMIKRSWNQAQAKLPFVSKKLPSQIDVFGKEKERFQDGSNTWFNVFLNPGFQSKYKTNPEIKMVMDIFNTTGEVKQAPRVVPTSQKITTVEGKSQNIKISPREQDALQRVVGEMTRRKFEVLADDLDFKNEDVSDQADILADILSDINQAAKVLTIGHRPNPQRMSKRAHGYITQMREDPELSKYLYTIP